MGLKAFFKNLMGPQPEDPTPSRTDGEVSDLPKVPGSSIPEAPRRTKTASRLQTIATTIVLSVALTGVAVILAWGLTNQQDPGPTTTGSDLSGPVSQSPTTAVVPTEEALDEAAGTLAALGVNQRAAEFASALDGIEQTYLTCSVAHGEGAFTDGQVLLDKVAEFREFATNDAPFGPPVFGLAIIDTVPGYPVQGARFYVVVLAVSCP